MIIAFVVAVWAAYFVPLVLRRYDEASQNASVETSGSLGRVIRRPTPAAAEQPASPVDEPVEPVRASATSAPRTLDRPAARLAAKRRRRTLLTLLGTTILVGVLAATSVIAPFWVAAPVGLVVAWLVACRIQVRGERGLARVKAPRLPYIPKLGKIPKVGAFPKIPRLGKVGKKTKVGKKSTWVADDEEDTVIVSGQLEDINPGRKHQMEDVPLEVTALDDQIVIAVPSVATTGEALWDPLPVTLPTYVTKPRAGRTVRTIDFGQAGAWTSGHIEGEDVKLPQRGDESGDERRAVGH